MLKSALIASVRSFRREQFYTAINVSGLAVGLITSIFIFLWVVDELSWDRYHVNRDSIFRVLENQTYSSGVIETYDGTPAPLAEKLKTDFAEIEESCRITWEDRMTVSQGEKSTFQSGVFADPAVFTMFTFPLLEGNSQKLLATPNSIVITKRMAGILFGDQPALGKSLRVGGTRDVVVTGVISDLPRASIFSFDFVLPMDVYLKENSNRMGWTHNNLSTYIRLRQGESPDALNDKIKTLLAPTNEAGDVIDLFLFRFTDSRLHYSFEQGVQAGGRVVYVRAFSLVAMFILLTACINFMNLATARSARRAREVGVRKVVGATRKNLVGQFLAESLLLSFVSLFIALLFVHLLTPLFNFICNKTLSLDYTNPVLLGGLLGITLITGLVAGSYPAFFLSSFRPAIVLHGSLHQTGKSSSLRNALVILQFSLSIMLVISALVVNQQMKYIREKDLGYDRENILVIPTAGISNMLAFRNELLQFPVIRTIGQGFDIPPNIYNNDQARWSAMPAGETVTVQSTVCDEDYIPALGYRLVEGRLFSRELISDSNAFIINEAAIRAMGIDRPLGQEITLYKMKGTIIGVVSDFHNHDLYSPIDPVIFVLGRSEKPSYAFVRYEPGKSEEVRQHITNIYKRQQPQLPLEIHHIEEYNQWTYRAEEITGRLSICFTIVILFIALLGLFGLTSYTTERRRKEIGIRKILGASVRRLVGMLCMEFILPLIISFFIGFPAAFYLMNKFLERFEYRTEPGLMIFAYTGAGLLFTALLTVGYQSASAATANPVDTLRAE